jgi:hypothetical protein
MNNALLNEYFILIGSKRILASIIGRFVFLRFIVDKIGIWAKININSIKRSRPTCV